MHLRNTRPIQHPRMRLAVPVAEVVAIVQDWVDQHACHLPGFAGAYLWGGITALPPDAPFALYRDVDVVVVFTHGAPEDEQEVFYRGVMLEVISKNLAEHENPETVLANPSAGPNLATTRILADLTGVLIPLQQSVAAGYNRRRWVQARCDAEKASADEALAAMRQAATPAERLDSARSFLGALSGLLAVAQLERPTTRRTLALLRELLVAQGRPDLHETALVLMGSAHMDGQAVHRLLDQSVSAFERAVQVRHTTVPYGFAIQAHLRPYYTEATQEMIDEGDHREAVFWITCLDTAYLVLQHDAPDDEKPVFAAQFGAICTKLGYDSADAWRERVRIAEGLAQEVYRIADDLAALRPD